MEPMVSGFYDVFPVDLSFLAKAGLKELNLWKSMKEIILEVV